VVEGHLRPARAEVDLDAIADNAALLRRLVAPTALSAVVKADGYGHGAVPVALAALRGGATWLAVALVEEGIELRQAGIEAPVLVLGEPEPDAMAEAVAHRLTLTVYTAEGVDALITVAKQARATGGPASVVHLKVDTGMHRLGADPDEAVALAARLAEFAGDSGGGGGAGVLRLEGLWTHLAVADEPDNAYTADQLERFRLVRSRLAEAGVVPAVVHAANSAGALAHPGARLDKVRCGISVYGYPPNPALGPLVTQALGQPLRPALSLRSRVVLVRELDAQERLSYGLRYRLGERSVVATVPLGYADGVPRALSAAGGEVLIGGRRCRMAGTITMDYLMVDCGPDATVATGDDVVLLGRQGDEVISADDWAARLGTISYEVLTGMGARVPRVYVGGRAASVGGGSE